jgi:hypothetical protein
MQQHMPKLGIVLMAAVIAAWVGVWVPPAFAGELSTSTLFLSQGSTTTRLFCLATNVSDTPVTSVVVTITPAPQSGVAYLGAADNVSGPLASRLSSGNQPVICTRNALSTLLPSLLADI